MSRDHRKLQLRNLVALSTSLGFIAQAEGQSLEEEASPIAAGLERLLQTLAPTNTGANKRDNCKS